ncbi:uncharacterized protein LOC107493343 [Arachis duranensis]|uniref:Uncharacterized protein LOC107493343 n=1 Tax=Arachis duranensis TaxID=130453 RepID=A0A6P4DKR6_ARADU|nr:uncharacterized protein LOC107493343 [Arachis duranensis]
MALQLADRTFKFPHGVVEDLLMKVGEFIFPADFVVLDMEEEANTSIILGRPFLATAGTIINVQKGELVLRLHKEKMVFNVFKAISYPKEPIGECMLVDTMEQIVQEVIGEDQCEENIELEQALDGKLPQATMRNSIMLTTTDNKDAESPKLELKALPPNLKYEYLDKANFKAIGELPTNINKHMRRKLINDAKHYIWDDPYLFKKCNDGVLRRCISHEEGQEVLWQCHGSAYGGHFSG